MSERYSTSFLYVGVPDWSENGGLRAMSGWKLKRFFETLPEWSGNICGVSLPFYRFADLITFGIMTRA